MNQQGYRFGQRLEETPWEIGIRSLNNALRADGINLSALELTRYLRPYWINNQRRGLVGRNLISRSVDEAYNEIIELSTDNIRY